jgi:HK97 family phage major capsid protein
MKDVEAKLAEKDAKIEEVIKQFSAQLAEKSNEIDAMRNSKRVFGDRKEQGDLSKWGKEFMHASLLGVMTGKGMNTAFARNVMEKAGIDYATNAGDIDQEVSRMVEKEITLNLRTAGLFREVPVNSAATVLPIQPDVENAVFQTGAATAGNLNTVGDTGFKVSQVILNAYRLISQTFMDNHVDEEVLVNLMPMLIDSVARAHARAVDNAIINGSGSITGLDGYATANADTLSIGGSEVLTAAKLLAARKDMGKYGINPSDVAYIVSQARYYELIEDAGFADITDVGSDVATKITGTVGGVYGSPVIVSDSFPAEATGIPVAFAVNMRNYVIPRLRGVTVEQDYEVGNQRRVIVATQSLGFEELVADAAGNRSAVKLDLAV